MTGENPKGDESFNRAYFFGDGNITLPEVTQTLTAFQAYLHINKTSIPDDVARRQLNYVVFALQEDAGLGDEDMLLARSASETYLSSLSPEALALEAGLVRFAKDWDQLDWSYDA